jgi:hypothetical protein
MNRPFERFISATPRNIPDELFSNSFTPSERKKLWLREYLRRGLEHCNGHRKETAEYLGMCMRSFRNNLNKFPDLKQVYPTCMDVPEITYRQKKAEFLRATPDYWLPSKKEYVEKELVKLAKSFGLSSI